MGSNTLITIEDLKKWFEAKTKGKKRELSMKGENIQLHTRVYEDGSGGIYLHNEPLDQFHNWIDLKMKLQEFKEKS